MRSKGDRNEKWMDALVVNGLANWALNAGIARSCG